MVTPYLVILILAMINGLVGTIQTLEGKTNALPIMVTFSALQLICFSLLPSPLTFTQSFLFIMNVIIAIIGSIAIAKEI